jgi:hypothetical protein
MDAARVNSQVEKLTSLAMAPGRYDLPYEDIRGGQVAAANERFQTRREKIRVLGAMADDAGITEVRSFNDLVPLLFAHTTYKSYPENWLIGNKWDRLTKWLGTVSTTAPNVIDTADIKDIDDWLQRLDAAGTYVSCSSGTTGKCSMIVASAEDRAFSRRMGTANFEWGTGIQPRNDFKVMGTVPIPTSPRNRDAQQAISKPFGDGSDFRFPGVPVTIGQVSQMVALRRRTAGGEAAPSEIANYDKIVAERQASVDRGMEQVVDALIEYRGKKLLVSGQFALMYQVSERVRAKGFGKRDYRADNAIFVGGGLKGAVLPENFLETIMDTFNVSFDRLYQYYGMQEINSTMPRCKARRYHVPPWVIVLMLDQHGENLLPVSGAEVEGRGGFFDLSLDGRWGGVISGDKIHLRYGRCDCGHEGPTVGSTIVRYSDLGDGDKITCAGTIEAYVRGMS